MLSIEKHQVQIKRYISLGVESIPIQRCGSIERTLDPVVLVGTRLKGVPSYLTLAALLTYMEGLPCVPLWFVRPLGRQGRALPVAGPVPERCGANRHQWIT